jgi:hypothetical protein
MVKRGPLTVALRLASDFATNVVGWVVAAFLLLGVILLLFTGPSTALVVGMMGIVATGIGLVLALDAVVMGTVWTHGARTAGDRDSSLTATGAFFEGLSRFGEVLMLRSLSFLTRLAVLAMFLAWAVPLVVVSTRSGGLWGSPVAVPAVVMAVASSLYAVAAGLVAMTVEMTAPVYFLKRRRLGPAIREAAGVVLERPVFVYRVFVSALAVLLPALALAWGASIAYALTFEHAQIAPLTAMLRSVANLILFASLGFFVVMLQFSFFAYYAHRLGLLSGFPPKFLDGPQRSAKKVPIAAMIPTSLVHRIRVSEVLTQRETDHDASTQEDEASGKGRESQESEQPETS